MSDKYFLGTGEIDRQRLTILSKLYNPPALHFLKNSGLQPGMTVLEIGCGTGHMACDLANYIGAKGKVIAIDSSAEQIAVAKETAKQAGVTNIDFHVCDVMNIDKLNINYDATYGRWVLEFIQQPQRALELMYRCLNPGGVLAYEAANMRQTAYFSCPYDSVIERWHDYAPKICSSQGYSTDLGYQIFNAFKKLQCRNIQLNISQAILITPEHKSVYRLGLISSTPAILANNVMSQHAIDKLMADVTAFENSDSISGFFHNILISGVKCQ